jgi:hypothetical protein
MCDSPGVDEQAWKRLRPVLATTLIPLAAAGGFFALATYTKQSTNPADRPSMAAFDACLTENGLQPQQSYPSQFDEQVAAQQEMKTCGNKIPKAIIDKWRRQAEASQSSFRECMQNMAGSGGYGFGRRGGDFRNAYVVCRSLLQGGNGGERAPVKPATTTPVAPVA